MLRAFINGVLLRAAGAARGPILGRAILSQVDVDAATGYSDAHCAAMAALLRRHGLAEVAPAKEAPAAASPAEASPSGLPIEGQPRWAPAETVVLAVAARVAAQNPSPLAQLLTVRSVAK